MSRRLTAERVEEARRVAAARIAGERASMSSVAPRGSRMSPWRRPWADLPAWGPPPPDSGRPR